MADALEPIDRWDGGVGWLAHPDESLQRASHALLADGGVWVVDPVDAPGVDDLLAGLGEVAGVVVGIGRHERDAAALASRYDVPVYLPEPLADLGDNLAEPTVVFDDELADTGYRARTVVDNRFWAEVALASDDAGTLVVPEAIGTAPHYVVAGERLGVHPALRLRPPRRALGKFGPDRILVGHGRGILEAATASLEAALATARRTAPRLYLTALADVVRGRGPWAGRDDRESR